MLEAAGSGKQAGWSASILLTTLLSYLLSFFPLQALHSNMPGGRREQRPASPSRQRPASAAVQTQVPPQVPQQQPPPQQQQQQQQAPQTQVPFQDVSSGAAAGAEPLLPASTLLAGTDLGAAAAAQQRAAGMRIPAPVDIHRTRGSNPTAAFMPGRTAIVPHPVPVVKPSRLTVGEAVRLGAHAAAEGVDVPLSGAMELTEAAVADKPVRVVRPGGQLHGAAALVDLHMSNGRDEQ
jgi:hypothetical protein